MSQQTFGPGGTGESIPVGQGVGTSPAAVVKVFNEEERAKAEAGTLLPKGLEGIRLDAGAGKGAADTETPKLSQGAGTGGSTGQEDQGQGQAAHHAAQGDKAISAAMPTAKLNNGASIPLLGLGTWKSAKGDVGRAVDSAVRMGYRHIDCAKVYGNEAEVGHAFSALFKEGVVKREELWVTSKLWNDDHDPDRVEVACRNTLKALQLEYLDLYLIHWPVTNHPGESLNPPYEVTWAAMEQLVEKGLVRSIGVSNLSVKKLEKLLGTCSVKPAVNQVEAHPWWRNDGLLRFCQGQGIHLTAYSPLGTPDSAALPGGSGRKDRLMDEPTVKKVAERMNKTPAQVLLRWALQRGTSAIPKSVSPERQRQNLDVITWELPEDAFRELSSIEPQGRMVSGNIWLNAEGPYRTVEELWDEEEVQQAVKK